MPGDPSSHPRAAVVRIRIAGEEIRVTGDEWEERVRSGRVPPDAQVCVEAITGAAFVEAQSLESWRALQAGSARARDQVVAGDGVPWLTALLVGVQVRIWWWMWWPDADRAVSDTLVNFAPAILERGEVWRLVTMGFLHRDYDHLALNMLWLAYCGWNVERALGRRNLLLVYGFAVVIGATLSMTMSPWRPSLGASGGVFGLLAVCVVFGLTRPDLLPPAGRRTYGFALLPYLLLMFWSGLQSETTDNWAHFGGLMAGVVAALVLDPEPNQRRAGWNNRWRSAIAAVATLAMAWPLAVGPRVVPLVDDRVASWEALRRSTVGADPPPPELTARSLAWAVPVGWTRSGTITGDVAFCSPVGTGCFGVREVRSPISSTDEEVQAAWLAGAAAKIGAPLVPDVVRDVPFAGRDGAREVVARVAGKQITWRMARRGRWRVEAVWQADEPSGRTAAALSDRLWSSVRWSDPAPYVEARDALALSPTSRTLRGRFAVARAEIGEESAAWRDLGALVDENPADEAAWIARLELLNDHPTVDAAPDAVWDAAMGAHPTPRVWSVVADGLEARGRASAAEALLWAGWRSSPGDRLLRRGLKARGLPVALDEATGRPWPDAVDVVSGARRPNPILAGPAVAMASLADVAAEMQREDARIVAAIAAMPAEDVVDLLVRVKDGGGNKGADIDRAGVIEDLRSLEAQRPPPWLRPALRAALTSRLAADPALIARVRRPAPSGPVEAPVPP